LGKIFFLPSKYSLFFKKWTADEKKVRMGTVQRPVWDKKEGARD
jgi:hypothetical protein